MISRRFFLRQTMASAAALGALNAGTARGAAEVSTVNHVGAGQTPDSLDLARHGGMALNGTLGTMNPELDYEIAFLTILDVHPAYMMHWSSMVSGVMVKYVESLPMLRLMSGSDQGRDTEAGFLEAMRRNAAEDGLIYDRSLPSRPWNTGVHYGKKDWDEDYANLAGNGRYLAGLTFWQQVSGDEQYRRRARRTAERMYELAIQDGEVAYYPNPGLGNDYSYPRQSGWTTTKPPQDPKEGFEGAAMFYLFQPLRGFVRYYRATGDEKFLDLSRKFVKLGMQPKFWPSESDLESRASFERGHFEGHYHGNLGGIRGLLDYGLVTRDAQVLAFCRGAYEYARNGGISALGLFTPAWGAQGTEGCTVADMIGLAVALTDAGLGDYWDDVEHYARNGLVGAQATDLEELRRVSEAGRQRPPGAAWGGQFDTRFQGGNKGVLPGQEMHDNVLERTVGAFGHVYGARYQTPMMMHCCTANCSQGLYYAWEGIVRRYGDAGVVNLWLNRRSPWVDVTSELPWRGRLRLRNKTLRTLCVRRPGWSRTGGFRCTVNGRDVEPRWQANQLVFGGLNGGEDIVIETPLTDETVTYTMVNLNNPSASNGVYECTFRGATAVKVVRVEPGTDDEDRNWYRLFRRGAMRSGSAPQRATDAYVHPEKLITWNVV